MVLISPMYSNWPTYAPMARLKSFIWVMSKYQNIISIVTECHKCVIRRVIKF